MARNAGARIHIEWPSNPPIHVSDPAVNRRFPATIILAMAKLGAGQGLVGGRWEAGLDKTGGHCPVYLGGRGPELCCADRCRPLGCANVRRAFAFKERPRAMARTNRKHRPEFAQFRRPSAHQCRLEFRDKQKTECENHYVLQQQYRNCQIVGDHRFRRSTLIGLQRESSGLREAA